MSAWEGMQKRADDDMLVTSRGDGLYVVERFSTSLKLIFSFRSSGLRAPRFVAAVLRLSELCPPAPALESDGDPTRHRARQQRD